MFASTILSIWYSWFKTLAVILPPNEIAPEIVTKSPSVAPWLLSVATIVEDPLVAAKVIPLVVVARIGVISLYPPPWLI